MRTYHVFGNVIDVNRFNNRISVCGDGGVSVLCFVLDRFVGTTDLADYRCIVKTRDAADHADTALPQVEALERELRVLWVLTRSSARAPGRLELQLEFHSRAGAEGENAFWQTCPAVFEAADSLDAGAVFLQEPTVFQQWAQRIDGVYSQMAASVDRINEIRAEIEKLAGDSGLLEIDAKTLNGRRVDDAKSDDSALWTAKRTAEAVAAGVAGIPLASAQASGLMPAADKKKLDGLSGGGLTLDSVQDLFQGDSYKFSDGTLICTRRIQVSATVDHSQSAEQDCWLSNGIEPGAFSLAFAEEPLIFAQLVNSRLRLLVSAQRSTTHWAALQLAWPQKLTAAQTATVALLAIGRWK